jgi:hypothetical protein
MLADGGAEEEGTRQRHKCLELAGYPAFGRLLQKMMNAMGTTRQRLKLDDLGSREIIRKSISNHEWKLK